MIFKQKAKQTFSPSPYGVNFTHPVLGSLTIDNGIDAINWSYNLNTAIFPTYGGEVVQILSIYIDNLTMQGTVTTYGQMNAIYQYFSSFLQIATQGRKKTQQPANSVTGTAYNLQPIIFKYPERHWEFLIYPQQLPGFMYSLDTVAPQWQLDAFVIDDSPDLGLIKDGIKAAIARPGTANAGVLFNSGQGPFDITGHISPNSGNPDLDPFQTYGGNTAAQQKIIGEYDTYFKNLLGQYLNGNLAAVEQAIGSTPNFGQTQNGPASQRQSSIQSGSTAPPQATNKQPQSTATVPPTGPGRMVGLS